MTTMISIGDCGKWVSGGTPKKSVSEFWNGDIPWISAKSLKQFDLSDSEDRVTTLGAEEVTLVPPETIIFVVRGMSLAKEFRVGLTTREVTFNQDLRAIIPADNVDARYLTRIMHAATARILGKVTNAGHGTKRLPTDDLKGIRIPMPKLSEQKRIAGILDKADSIVRKRQQAIGLTEQFLRSTFLDMFGDPVTNPKGWPVEPLKNLISCGFQNGAYYPKDKYTSDGSGVEMVHMSNAFCGSVELDGIKRVRAPASDIEKYGLDENDILVARRSLNYEGSAKPCRVPKIDRGLIFESSLIRVTTAREKLHPLYFYYFLSNPRARSRYVFQNVTKSTISGINQTGLGRVNVVLPPLAAQERFVEFHDQYDASCKRLQTNVAELDNLFNSLVQGAFRGEL